MLNIKLDTGKIIIETDDRSVQFYLQGIIQETGYNFFMRRMDMMKKNIKIYDKAKTVKGITTFTLGRGWLAYIMNVFKDHISKETYDTLHRSLLSDYYVDTPFPNLRNYQNSDILHLLKYKVGLFQVAVGLGKSEMIATLTNYFVSIGKRVLLICPGSKAKDELNKRVNLRFGLEPSATIGDPLCSIITSGVLNRKDLKKDKDLEAKLSSYDVILVDEVEYTINPGGMFLYDRLQNAEFFYGFSGTADKYNGQALTFREGLSENILRNKDLIKYFGPALVYRLPTNKQISQVVVKTKALDFLKLQMPGGGSKTNIYNEVMNQIWTDPKICECIVKICKAYPQTFIPMNNLTTVITEWIDKWFKGVFRVLLVCGEGYIYHDLDGNKKNLSLVEACDYIREGKVDVIPSTSAGYRALDFPGLENILLCIGKVAGVVIQALGRCSRGTHMNIITMEPYGEARKIPVFSKAMEERETLFSEYYKYCMFDKTIIGEDLL